MYTQESHTGTGHGTGREQGEEGHCCLVVELNIFVLKDQICDLETSLGESGTWMQLFPQFIDENAETQRS